jgi:prepilin peptidase CpaA
MEPAIQLTLAVVVVVAAWRDFRTRRIPNWVTLPGAVLGFALQAWYGGGQGAIASLTGAVMGFAIFIALYIAGGMGAGDVKLFSAVGAFVGPESLIVVFVFTGLLGGIAAGALAMSRGRLRQTFGRTGALLVDLGRLRFKSVRAAGTAADALRLPYGAVIAGGTLMFLVTV